MTDDRFDLRNVELREVIPWVHLFRGFRIALDLKKLALGAAGAVLMAFGWSFIALWFIGERPTAPEKPEGATGDQLSHYELEQLEYQERLNSYNALEESRYMPWDQAERGTDVYRSVLDPSGKGWRGGIPASAFLTLEPIRRLLFPAGLTLRGPWAAIPGTLLMAWTLLVWSLFGGAITRISAVQVARDGHVGLGEALTFVIRRYLSYLGAPVFPFLGVVFIVILCAIAGFILSIIPGIDVLAGIIWFLPLAAGFVMTIMLFGLVLGWPLMFAAISAEATESFDSLSRSYSYVLTRPWHYLFYSVLAILYGAIVMVFVTAFSYAVLHMSQYSVAWGGGETELRQLYAYVPLAGGWRESFGPEADSPTGTTYVSALFVGLWAHVFFLGIVGFAYSYFWSQSTIIYFLLRRDVDETEFEEVFIEEEDDEPFPTAPPTLTDPSGKDDKGGDPSLPIVDPPQGS
ncbi:hypothetical protein Pan216_00310 [Planctomycetes bacterium Pan216]|uniref:Uncharacterized protein n=2 Tax=Kolteria novifilia TaxID=2527975 RepID=A0A518AWV1_9BACT|nr:hypothetical protein Pan216_00310 [Planctomycetes bacterium Pan216]